MSKLRISEYVKTRIDMGDKTIAVMTTDGKEAEEMAAKIVRAVNAHKVLRRVAGMATDLKHLKGRDLEEAIILIDAVAKEGIAIAKAEGK